MSSLVGGPSMVGGLEPGDPWAPLNPALLYKQIHNKSNQPSC